MREAIPMNAAEAVIAPFWDPAKEELSKWDVLPGEEYGLDVYQFWCWTSFEWIRNPGDRAALSMHRDLELSCAGYDRLLASIVAPDSSTLVMTITTDRGKLEYRADSLESVKIEHAIALEGATVITGIDISISEGPSGARSGWFNWIGLQAADVLPAYERQWQCWDSSWEGYLQPAGYVPNFEPAHGILIDANEIETLRETHKQAMEKLGTSPIVTAAEQLRGIDPEKSIGEYVSFYSSTRKTSDTRYNRQRDEDKLLVTRGQHAVVAALLLEDAELLRLAARYALSIAMCSFWEDGMINHFPGSTFDTRCFVQSLCLHDIAVILDLAGEMFTDLGRTYLLRRLSQEGLATVTYNTWRYEYLFHCNQLAWFTPGRMYAHLVVERSWPRAKAHTEICLSDLTESMDLSILDDGGYVEGPNYFQCVGRDAVLSYYYYARARGLDLESIVPERIRRTAAFGAAIESTDERHDAIPICDAKAAFDQTALVFLSHLMPGSGWTRMLSKSLKRSGAPETIIGLKFVSSPARDSMAEARPAPSLVVLPDMGLVASTRLYSDRVLKILVMGNHAGAGHTHEDKGSFVLEYAGETLAMDPGTADYSHPLSNELKQCQRHNMLVPFGMSERPHPKSPLPADITPNAEGDEHGFESSTDLSAGWERYYRMWTRRISSTDPSQLLIEDDYELVRGDGVTFYWQTELEAEKAGRGVMITGNGAIVEIESSSDCTVSVEELPLPGRRVQRRIGFSYEGTSGHIEIRASVRPA